jgi:hypothetical protein
MKKLIFEKETILQIIKLYTEEHLGSHTISLKTGIGKKIIQNLLKKNGIILRKPGRTNLGGKKIANKKWSDNNKEYVSKKYKVWAIQNKEHLKEYRKNYQKENKDRIRIVKRNYERTRKSKDPIYKLIANFRTAIYTVLKEQNIQKNGHYFDILGYSQQDLIDHLSKQLNNGMTWENYGDWHVDHKIPIDAFTFETTEDPDFRKCWSLENLQPMWGTENIKKGKSCFVIT